MIRLRVERSPVRQFLAGVAGLLLILAAIDIVWLHRVAGPPSTNPDGTLTSRGIVDKRMDVVWGSALLVGGTIVLLGAVAGLAIRRPVVEMTDDELRLRVGRGIRSGSPLGVVAVPWSDVIAVRSTTDETDGWEPTRVLVVEVVDPYVFPPEPWGAEWNGSQLVLDADGWQVAPEEVAMRAEMLIRRHGGRVDPAEPVP